MASRIPGIDEILRAQVLRSRTSTGTTESNGGGSPGTGHHASSTNYPFPSFEDIISEETESVDWQDSIHLSKNESPSQQPPKPPPRPSYTFSPPSPNLKTDPVGESQGQGSADVDDDGFKDVPKPMSPVIGESDLESTIDASSARLLLNTYISLSWYLLISTLVWISLIALSYILPKLMKGVKWGTLKLLNGLDWSLLNLVKVGRWVAFLSVTGLATAMGVSAVLWAFFSIPSVPVSTTITSTPNLNPSAEEEGDGRVGNQDPRRSSTSSSSDQHHQQQQQQSPSLGLRKSPTNLRLWFIILLITPCLLTLAGVSMLWIIIPLELVGAGTFGWLLTRRTKLIKQS